MEGIKVGTVKFFNEQKGHGYGFITDNETGKEVYFHYTAIDSNRDFKKVFKGWTVRYIIGKGPDGRDCATWVCGAKDLAPVKEKKANAAN